MSDEEVRTCVSCKHFEGPRNEYQRQLSRESPAAGCLHPKAVTRDVVYGRCLCMNERASKKGCGRSGRLWEASK